MIEIRNEQEIFDNPLFMDRITLLMRKILSDHKAEKYSVSLLFCDNSTIEKLNSLYRGKNTPTDVLSFSLIEGETLEDFSQIALEGEDGEIYEMLGDVVISTEKAKTQALENNFSWEEEIANLVIHGTLHLLGYDHERGPEDEKIMFEKQDSYLEWFLSQYPEYQAKANESSLSESPSKT
ncbi:rRNA maturation RNase YbeY [Thermospira aquatica]|uniref:Endoribonuclease YbeY n=1 Tax=Thermospira aquatica TaxID=2828656 RepID=A0AAX3BDW3_9SPIR|nr:rRNA maturation RNase YbeY [Thermospira aquatica]URA10353.1 rRNA maturation RNase YbeY [Thermospira aquatica]